jgi:hypothetical protein
VGQLVSQVHISLDSDPGTALNGTTITVNGDPSDTEVNAIMSLRNDFGNSRDLTVRIVKRLSDPVVDQFCSGVCIEKNASNSISDNEWVFPMTLTVGSGETIEFKPGYKTQGMSFCAINDYYVENQFGTKIDSVRVKFIIGGSECFLSTADFNHKAEINVYPNPASTYLTIENVQLGDSFELYDMLGKRVIKTKIASVNHNLSLSDLPDGVYFYTIKDSFGNQSASKKLIIRK